MKKLLTVLMAILTLNVLYGKNLNKELKGNYKQWARDGIIITAGFSKKEYDISENIDFKITIANTSKEVITINYKSQSLGFEFFLFQSGINKIIPTTLTTPRDKNDPQIYYNSRLTKTIKPNQQYTIDFKNFKNYFAVSTGGEYSLKLIGNFVIPSNSINWLNNSTTSLDFRTKIFKIDNMTFSVNNSSNMINENISELKEKPHIIASVDSAPYIYKIKKLILNGFEKGNKAFVVTSSIKLYELLPENVSYPTAILPPLNNTTYENFYNVLGKPAYSINLKEKKLVLNCWLFDNGVILYAELMKIPDDKVINEKQTNKNIGIFCWDSINIPKNVKKVYVNKPKEKKSATDKK